MNNTITFSSDEKTSHRSRRLPIQKHKLHHIETLFCLLPSHQHPLLTSWPSVRKIEGITFGAALLIATLAGIFAWLRLVSVRQCQLQTHAAHRLSRGLLSLCHRGTHPQRTGGQRDQALGVAPGAHLHALCSHHSMDQTCFTQCLLCVQHLCQNLEGRDRGNEDFLKAHPSLGHRKSNHQTEETGQDNGKTFQTFFKLLYLHCITHLNLLCNWR